MSLCFRGSMSSLSHQIQGKDKFCVCVHACMLDLCICFRGFYVLQSEANIGKTHLNELSLKYYEFDMDINCDLCVYACRPSWRFSAMLS